MQPKSLPEAARCNPSLCRRLPDATQVSAGGCQMQPKSPAGGCQMQPKSLPEAARCNPSLCRRLPDATQVSAGGCQMQPKSLPGGCQMQPKSLPEAARCNPSLCRRLPDATQVSAGCEGNFLPEAARCKQSPCRSLASTLLRRSPGSKGPVNLCRNPNSQSPSCGPAPAHHPHPWRRGWHGPGTCATRVQPQPLPVPARPLPCGRTAGQTVSCGVHTPPTPRHAPETHRLWEPDTPQPPPNRHARPTHCYRGPGIRRQ